MGCHYRVSGLLPLVPKTSQAEIDAFLEQHDMGWMLSDDDTFDVAGNALVFNVGGDMSYIGVSALENFLPQLAKQFGAAGAVVEYEYDEGPGVFYIGPTANAVLQVELDHVRNQILMHQRRARELRRQRRLLPPDRMTQMAYQARYTWQPILSKAMPRKSYYEQLWMCNELKSKRVCVVHVGKHFFFVSDTSSVSPKYDIGPFDSLADAITAAETMAGLDNVPWKDLPGE